MTNSGLEEVGSHCQYTYSRNQSLGTVKGWTLRPVKPFKGTKYTLSAFNLKYIAAAPSVSGLCLPGSGLALGEAHDALGVSSKTSLSHQPCRNYVFPVRDPPYEKHMMLSGFYPKHYHNINRVGVKPPRVRIQLAGET